MVEKIRVWWKDFSIKHPAIARFIIFNLVGGLVTLMQIVLLPLLKLLFAQTNLINTTFQVLPIGHGADGGVFYMFNYPAGAIAQGGGGGLAYFLAVQITLLAAQVANFFLQRKVTFKSDASVGKAMFWYLIAYIAVTFLSAALQGVYREPLYRLLTTTWNWGKFGETVADVVVVLINCLLQFVVFYPLFHIIFPERKKQEQ